jgi:hypothetical protein
VKHPSWDNPIDHTIVGLDFIQEMEEKMEKIRKKLKASQDKKKICVDKGRNHKEFGVGDHTFLKVKYMHSSLKLGKCSKLEVHYCGPFEIPERIGPVAYVLAVPVSLYIHNVFHVSFLKKCVPDANHVISIGT